MEKDKKIIFICTGNTCRSPMAKGLFEKMLFELKDESIHCESAGLSTMDGTVISNNAAEVCKECGIDISEHKAKNLTSYMLDFDFFVAMTADHAFVLKSIGIHPDKIYVLGGGIRDPYGGDIEAYRICRNQINEALKEFYNELYFE